MTKDERHSATNGWREGHDPIQRWLRIVTTIVVLGVFVFLAVDPARRATGGDFPTLALVIGCVLVLLGYEGAIRLPFIGRNGNSDNERR